MARENGPIENAQLGVIAASIVLFATLAVKSRDAERMAAVAIAATSAIFLVREVDLRQFGRDFALAFVDDRLFTSIWYGALFLSLFIYALWRHDLILPCLRFARSRNAWPLVLVGMLFLSSSIAERLARDGDPRLVFAEEASELIGFFAILFAGLSVLAARARRLNRIRPDGGSS